MYGIIEAQALGMKCAFLDFERTFDKSRAVSLGVDLEDLVVYEPAHIEDAFEFIRNECENGIKFFIYDSV